MMTAKHIERQWTAKNYGCLLNDLLEARPEGKFRFDSASSLTARTAALALIRLEELDQSHLPIAVRLIRTLLAMQESDGGWGEPALTALVLRALFCCNGSGAVIDRGLVYLANLQRSDGLWPAVPLRRMPGDAAVSAFILGQLADRRAFRDAVRFEAAAQWFATNRSSLDTDSLRAWERAENRRRLDAVSAQLSPALLS
jgi:hypothetical protein